jgi:glyoxylase-like metal-dependent hydrolase (beta-lactamase superfamily II)
MNIFHLRFVIIFASIFIAAFSIYLMFCARPLSQPQPLTMDLPPASPPKEMAVFKIMTGVNHRSAAFGYRGGSFFDKRDFTMDVLLIKHPKGDLLIDAGLGRDSRVHFKSLPWYFRAITDFDPGRSAADQLKDVGYDEDSLKGILLTHTHWDHVSGIPDFNKTPVWINKEERHFINDGKQLTALIRSFPNVQYKEYAFTDTPYLNFPKSYDVYGDGAIVIVPAPGHTPGSVVIFIALPSGERLAMIGDLAWQQEGVLEREERPWPQRTMGDDNPEQVRENLLRMAAIANRFPQITIVPAHDARGFDKVPDITKIKMKQ